jgi:hypothetical protein
MYTYGLLEIDCFYLIKEKENSPILLITATLETDHCLFLDKYKSSGMVTFWKKKDDPIFEIIECLEDRMAQAWQDQYGTPGYDSYYDEEDEDDEENQSTG